MKIVFFFKFKSSIILILLILINNEFKLCINYKLINYIFLKWYAHIFWGNFTPMVSHCLLEGLLIQFGFLDGAGVFPSPCALTVFSKFPNVPLYHHTYRVGFSDSLVTHPMTIPFASVHIK